MSVYVASIYMCEYTCDTAMVQMAAPRYCEAAHHGPMTFQQDKMKSQLTIFWPFLTHGPWYVNIFHDSLD